MANHSGYVQVDWKKVEKDVNKAKKHLKKKANKAAPEINTFIEEVKVSVTTLCSFLFFPLTQPPQWFLHLGLCPKKGLPACGFFVRDSPAPSSAANANWP